MFIWHLRVAHIIYLHIFEQDIKDLNKYILGVLKKMAKPPKTETLTESKMQTVSILSRKIQKIKEDHHFKNVDVNDFHMGIHTLVSMFTTSFKSQKVFQDKSDGLYYLLLE